MSSVRREIPRVSQTANSAQARFFDAVKEHLDIYAGRGDALDRVVTFRDLLQSGVFAANQDGSIAAGRIANPFGTNYIDLNAEGNQIAMKFGNGIEIEADGDARFGGVLTALAVNAVNTINVAGNAITANVRSNLSSAVTLTGSQQDIVTVTITTTGGPVIILASTNSQLNSGGVAGGNPNNRLYVYRDSTLIAPVDGVTNFAHAFSNAPASISVLTQMTFIVHDQPAPGTYTYKLRARTDVTGQASNVFHSTIIAIELKR